MTTREKTAAIQQIVANEQDNVAAKNAANVGADLEGFVIEAIYSAFKDDLANFVGNPPKVRKG